MTYEEKCEKWKAKNGREIFREKTDQNQIPIRMEYGSSTHHPDRKGGISTADIKFWVKFCDGDWFKPYGMNYMIES